MSWRRFRVAVAAVALCLSSAGCGSSPEPAPTPGASSAPAPEVPTRTAQPSATTSATITPIPEPTTTNTLPPPPRPSKPAPSTAGRLGAASLPVPAGWKTVALPGGDEEGYRGNGTWVHARDARYAAQDVITLGCAPVTRDDYTDPTSALEGNYQDRHARPGVGLVMEFDAAAAAEHFFGLLVRQVEACEHSTEPVHTALIPSAGGLIDRRTYPDGEWIEMGRRVGRRVTLVILSDPGHKMSAAAAESVLRQMT